MTRRQAVHDAMVRLADGDRGAFPVLIDELWPVVLAFVQRSLRQRADAEDLAQEVFFRICSRISDFDRSRDALSWVFGIASYEVMSHRRRSQRRREVLGGSGLPDPADVAPSHEEVLIRQELAVAFEQAVGQLSEEDRRSLGLFEPSGNTLPGGAAVRKRRQRALGRLRDVWRRINGDS